jgi:hypothetical protein
MPSFDRGRSDGRRARGPAAGMDALRHRIKKELGWRGLMPDHGQTVELQ